jgi:hypothetical protein
VFVDTSFWAAYFNRRDRLNKMALSLFAELEKSDAVLYTTDYILDELLTLLRKREGLDIALKSAEYIIHSNLLRIVRVSEDVFNEALRLFALYKDQVFSFTDCTSFSVIEKLKIEKALSFDADFKKYGKVIVLS